MQIFLSLCLFFMYIGMLNFHISYNYSVILEFGFYFIIVIARVLQYLVISNEKPVFCDML